jgi:TonB family protein
MVLSFLASRLVVAQTPGVDNLYVLHAGQRQATTTAPLTLMFSEAVKQGRKRVVRETEGVVPASDVNQVLTTLVRAQKTSVFAFESGTEFLFVLDVRSRHVPAHTSDPLILTLASGAVLTVPSSAVHAAATRWLRMNLPTERRTSAASAHAANESAANTAPGQRSAGAPSLQFDTKGVEFGPWVRAFVAQLRRNWVVPKSEMFTNGRVVVTFFVHRNGAITDATVLTPASAATLNKSALDTVVTSSPVQPLPAEYPEEAAFFTITFYFNEVPDQPIAGGLVGGPPPGSLTAGLQSLTQR